MSYADPVAESVLYERYSIFISKKIRDFHLISEFDDIFQECLMLLDVAVDRYIDSEVPFYSFYMKMLINKLSTFYNRKKRSFSTLVYDYEECLMENYYQIEDIDYFDAFKNLTKREKKLVHYFYIEKWDIRMIEKEFGYTKAHIYYILKKIRIKVENNTR